ncbi:putative EXPERA domain-containing protein [Seiridium cardinale]|uniref:EXPERA domain-containing protein n=1 Tax=Seiridium cardinale TaxID=138064 RepID=A0ABR2XQ39_9PEZI
MAEITASLLPLIPRIFFLYLEPILITFGILMTYANRIPLLSSLPKTSFDIPTLSAPAISCTYLLSMMLYGSIILLSSPPNKRLLKLHIGVLMLADLTHWYALFSTVAEANGGDWGKVLDTASWDPRMWDLAIYPFGTFLIKFATLREWFGPIRG